MCEGWVKGGFQRSGQKCQFLGVLGGIVFGIKYAYAEVWQSWWRRGRWRDVEVELPAQQVRQLGAAADSQPGGGVWLMHAFFEMTEEIEFQARGQGGGRSSEGM